MLLRLFLLFTIIPIAEIYLLIKVGDEIGMFNTIVIVVLTGIIGASFAKSQGGMLISKIKSELNQGSMPGKELLEGALVLAGGIMLITPGIMTDLFGFSLIIPITRKFYRKILFRFFKKNFKVQNFQNNGFQNDYDNDDDNIIDV